MVINRILSLVLFLSVSGLSLNAQLLEPFLSSPQLSPAPMTSVLANGTAQIEFNLNQVDADIPLTAGDPIYITVDMQNVSPDGGIAAVSGTAASLFSWNYNSAANNLTGEQIAAIPGNLYSGNILIDVNVDNDTNEAAILNGYQANIVPSSTIGTSNDLLNDIVSAYTWAGSDISKSVTFLPSVVNGINSGMYIQCRITEQNNVATEGPITIILPKDPRLTFAYDPNLTSDALGPVNNTDWVYDGSNASFHIWTSNTQISPLGLSAFTILNVTYDAEGSTGSVSYTFSIISGSGSENDYTNNIDVETLSYFSN